MERHGHLDLDAEIRAKLLQVSAATIDRALGDARSRVDGQSKRRTGVGAAIRSSIPVRTFSDRRDPPPGFFQVDMVEHWGGAKTDGLEQTRSRAYKKNDQAWVEQKNGAIVRRLVYGRLSGLAATQALAQLYCAARLYVNFFQPSFKLKSKTRDSARVSKTYHAPATPCDRLLASPGVSENVKLGLKEHFDRLDPVLLLRDIRAAQQVPE